MAFNFCSFENGAHERARKDEVMGMFCAPARARRAQAPFARQPRGRAHRARFNGSCDKGSFGALQGIPGAPLCLGAVTEPQRGARPAGIADGRGQLIAGLR